ncbi:hypothetical protein SAMN02787073_0474 [Chryseobacterium vrystaatense]|uniref:histidine kinase n=2 Tax=Chryseobacterium vrystaatense TaxID=307480 RepID=A0A1M4TXQ8_9FLAO|nr:hypothetical protein SAMN02787073_0474 [Chryseobacterium vrystaatense]
MSGFFYFRLMIRLFLFFSIFIITTSCQKNVVLDKDTAKGDAFYDRGMELFQKNDVLAYENFQKAISLYKLSHDSSNISKVLIYQANIQNSNGDYTGAEETLVEALSYMKDGDTSFYSVYGTMANIKSNQKEYSASIKWINKTLTENINYRTKARLLNNKASALSKIKDYKNALKILNSIVLDSVDNKEANTIRDNIEYILWSADNHYNAEPELETILKLRILEDDKWGMNASYSHLSDINKDQNPEKSLFYAKQMLVTAKKNKSSDDRLEALEKILITDTPLNSKKTFNEYKTLSDSIQAKRDSYSTQFAYIKYDSEKKETENQRLKVDQAHKENQLIRQQAALAVAIVAIIIIVILYRRRQARLKQENELKLKNDQLRISKRVHDVVANGIYQVMTKIENQEDFDKENALDELEFVYEKSRDISYEKPELENNKKHYKEKISTLIASFKNDTIQTYTVGNENEIWLGVSQSSFDEVYQILRELLVNMKKHSQASRVVFKFEKFNNMVKIQYTDNGIGIPGDMIYKNGLTNTGTRIAAIHGAIIFDNESEKGLKINISFPVS